MIQCIQHQTVLLVDCSVVLNLGYLIAFASNHAFSCEAGCQTACTGVCFSL